MRAGPLTASLLAFATLAASAQSPAVARDFISVNSSRLVSGILPEVVSEAAADPTSDKPARLGTSGSSSMGAMVPLISVARAQSPEPSGIDWKKLFASSVTFITTEHAFRLATEPSTRLMHHQAVLSGYADSITNLHGWGDGDPFLINYVGHPMQGAVAGYLWQHSDRRYRGVQFGRDRDYWRERIRGMEFAWVYSTQFEIGPISEASIGHVQSWPPQVGFVDHVITPLIGTGWAIGEDAIDRLVVQRFEQRIENPWIRLLLRGGLNPARSFANVMGGEVPWNRDDRPGVFKPVSERSAAWTALRRSASSVKSTPSLPAEASFEMTFQASNRTFYAHGQSAGCIGGDGVASFRLSTEWQLIAEVGGCEMLGFDRNRSGDSLTFLAGPRWSHRTIRRWVPHLEALVGGAKITQEYEDPYLKAAVSDWPTDNDESRYLKQAAYTAHWSAAGLAVQAGAGIDYKINNALALHVADLSYTHAWIGDVNGSNYQNSVQLSYGLVLRMGTW